MPHVDKMLCLSEEEMATASRAAVLAKADLATNMVVEMTSLQGIMGGHYARRDGEPAEVAAAIAEQYESVSQTKPGLALALADRLDSLAGLFAAGLAPKGSNDPFALRRAAIQIVENLVANRVNFDLKAGLKAAAELLPIEAGFETRKEALAFISDRLSVILQEQGHKPTTVRAVLAEQSADPYAASVTTAALSAAIDADGWEKLLEAYARCVRITRTLDTTLQIRPDEYALAEEKALYAAYKTAADHKDGSFKVFLQTIKDLEPAIVNFFDEVLVMDEDEGVRNNRLALLQGIANLASGIVDLSEVEGF